MSGPRHRTNEGGSLLRVEIARLSARRFVQTVVALSLLGFVVFGVVAFTQFSQPTPEILAEAERVQQSELELNEQFRQDCLDQADTEGEDPDFFCGPELTADDLPLEYFIAKQPFTRSDDFPAGSLAIAAATAMIGFVVGATYIGAEWSSRSIVALLFWETRRIRVIAVKTGVIAVAAALFAAVGQLAWFGLGNLLASQRGRPESLPDFWSDAFGQAGRSIVLVVLATLVGFGLSNLTRNTGAALGVAFAYFAVVETALRNFLPSSQPYLLTDNSIALLIPGGLSIYLPGVTIDDGSGFISEFTEFILSNLRGGLTLALYTAVLIAVGTWLFRRRDLH